ncbi:MAG: ATP-binding cassette domain-containing protein [Gemmatimonadota bacterium]|nr:ATP-binding cassette domain-containing protein [Gemmatimonadota bacterium]
MSEHVLEISHLTGPAGRPAVFDVCLDAPRGGLTVVLGPIHAGKTMLLRHILGLECAERGGITIDGDALDARGETEAVLRRARSRTGVVFQGAALLRRLSVLENVELPLLEHTDASPKQARELAHWLLEDVGVSVGVEMMPDDLDRAEQRRVALARALALRPPLLLLDEPTSGLDSHAASELDDTLQHLQQWGGFGIVIFSHDVRYAFGHSGKVHVMVGGSIIESGDGESLRESQHEIVRRLLDRRGAA